MYLLDTNVISELRRPKPHAGVVDWLSKTAAEEVFISAVTVGELQIGVENIRVQDPERAETIERWLGAVVATYNVLPMGVAEFRRWASLIRGKPREIVADAMIAATAQVHDLTVATRNLRDFERLGVAAIDPFKRD